MKKKIVALMALVTIAVSASCGGGGGGGFPPDDSPTIVRVMALYGAYIAYVSHNYGTEQAFELVGQGIEADKLSGYDVPINATYENFGGTVADTLIGEFSWEANFTTATTATLTYPLSGPLDHDSVFVNYPLAGATIAYSGTNYTGNGTTSDSNPVNGIMYGSVNLVINEDEEPTLLSLDITANSSVTNMTVNITAPEEATGIVSYTEQSLSSIISDNDLQMSSAKMQSTVVYDGTTYTCYTGTSYMFAHELPGTLVVNDVSCTK